MGSPSHLLIKRHLPKILPLRRNSRNKFSKNRSRLQKRPSQFKGLKSPSKRLRSKLLWLPSIWSRCSTRSPQNWIFPAKLLLNRRNQKNLKRIQQSLTRVFHSRREKRKLKLKRWSEGAQGLRSLIKAPARTPLSTQWTSWARASFAINCSRRLDKRPMRN